MTKFDGNSEASLRGAQSSLPHTSLYHNFISSKSILKIKRDNHSEIQNKCIDPETGAYARMKRNSELHPLLSSQALRNPNVHELIRIKCNDFLASNLKNHVSVSESMPRRTSKNSSSAAKSNLNNEYDMVKDYSRLKIQSNGGIPMKG